jgi:hypothetical protein
MYYEKEWNLRVGGFLGKVLCRVFELFGIKGEIELKVTCNNGKFRLEKNVK